MKEGILMAIKADFHLHSHFSGDCQEPMENMIQKGIELGLTHMCFTEHMDMDFPVTELDPEGKFLVNTDSYLYELIGLKQKYAGKINILFGIELGLQPHLNGNWHNMPSLLTLILSLVLPIFVTKKTHFILLSMKEEVRKRLIGNISLPYWIISKPSPILMYMVISIMLSGMVQQGMKTILIHNTRIF